MNPISSEKSSAVSSGEVCVHRPHQTPTIETPFTPEGSNVEFICDLNGNAIGFRKTSAILNEYNFDLRIFEERYNVVNIQGGRLGLMNAR